jgi:hypothetical protein
MQTVKGSTNRGQNAEIFKSPFRPQTWSYVPVHSDSFHFACVSMNELNETCPWIRGIAPWFAADG